MANIHISTPVEDLNVAVDPIEGHDGLCSLRFDRWGTIRIHVTVEELRAIHAKLGEELARLHLADWPQPEAKPATLICPTCDGERVVDGLVVGDHCVEQRCPRCKGEGRVPADGCRACGATIPKGTRWCGPACHQAEDLGGEPYDVEAVA